MTVARYASCDETGGGTSDHICQCGKGSPSASDSGGYTCSDYPFIAAAVAYCGDLDDTDFKANDMCCACGGGATPGNAC